MTAAPPPADEQAAADELDKYIAHTTDCETVMLEGYPCICGSTAAIAAYSRTQTEAVLAKIYRDITVNDYITADEFKDQYLNGK